MRLSEYVEGIGTGKKLRVRCRSCRKFLSDSRGHWKEKVPHKEYPLKRAGSLMSASTKYVLREFYCPSCRILLDLEVVEPGEPFLLDELKS